MPQTSSSIWYLHQLQEAIKLEAGNGVNYTTYGYSWNESYECMYRCILGLG